MRLNQFFPPPPPAAQKLVYNFDKSRMSLQNKKNVRILNIAHILL